MILVAVVLGLVGAGALLAPAPKRWVERTAPLAVWRREAVRERLQQRRLLVLIYFGLIAMVLIVWMLPSVLTEHPQIPKSADRHKAITDTRTGLVALLAAIGAAGGLAYTARTYRLSREGHFTDRYSNAVEQLGHKEIAVRLGGIFALERLMRDSPADQPTIMETLAAFVRQQTPPELPPVGPPRPDGDVQAVLAVLGRRDPVEKERPINLEGTVLSGALLDGANLAGARLYGANLAGARLYGTNLSEANLMKADLTGAWLHRVNLTGTKLDKAILKDVRVTQGALSEEQLASAVHAETIRWFEHPGEAASI